MDERTFTDELMSFVVWTMRGGWSDLLTILIVAAGLYTTVDLMGAAVLALGGRP